ncbi:hypothetical protein D3C75_282140 [compost metagenome]
MTEVRDWHKDMELAHHARYEFVSMQPRHLNTLIDALFHWLQQYAAEKERADKASDTAAEWICKYKAEEARFQRQNRELAEAKERENKLREAIEQSDTAKYLLKRTIDSLYPLDKEEETC